MVLHAGTGLRRNDLIDVVQVDAAGEQQDHEKHAGDFLVMLVERIGDGLDLVLRHGLLQPWCDGHHEKGQPAYPDHG